MQVYSFSLTQRLYFVAFLYYSFIGISFFLLSYYEDIEIPMNDLISFMDSDEPIGNVGNPPVFERPIFKDFPSSKQSPLTDVVSYKKEYIRKSKDLYEDWVWVENPKTYYEEYIFSKSYIKDN